MSWTVGTRVYHDYGEYQRALADATNQSASAQLERLQRQAEQQGRRIRDRERELDTVRGNLEAQVRVNRALQSDVADLRRTQEEMGELQVQMERRIEADFELVRSAAEQTRADLAEVSRQQAHQTAEMRQRFEQGRQELQRGLVEAEQQRARMEQRLQSAIDDVSEKLEQERQRRLAAIADRVQQARVQADLAEGAVRAVDGELTTLDLEEEARSSLDKVNQARGLADRGDASSALAVGHTAFAEASTLAHRAMRRRAELAAVREGLLYRVSAAESELQDRATQAAFAGEVQRAQGLLQRLRARIQTRYVNWRRLEVEAERDSALVRSIEQQVGLMTSSAPGVVQQARRRNDNVGKIVESLKVAYGPLSSMQTRHVDPTDKKSDLVLECNFGGVGVQVVLGLDGRAEIDAFGHGSRTACGEGMRTAVEALQRVSMPEVPQLDAQDGRSQPMRSPATSSEGWSSVGSQLREIERGVSS